MSIILIVSIVIRLVAMSWSIVLLRRIRDWRMGFLTVMLGLMAMRQILAMLGEKNLGGIPITGYVTELPGLLVSVMALLVTFFLERIITEHRWAETQRHESEARLATILNIAADAIITVDKDQRILHFNQGAEQIFGYRAEEILTKPLDILLPARFIKAHRQHISAFAASPRSAWHMGKLSQEIFGRRKDGSEFPADASISKLTLGGQTTFTVILRDITKRVWTAQALRQKVNDLAALYEASQVFLDQIDAETILEAVCRLAVEHFGLKMAWVGLVVEGDYSVHPAAAYGFEEDYLRSIRITWNDAPTGRGPTGTAIRTAQAVAMNRIETDPAYAPWRSAAGARGYRSSAALPLLYGEKVLGALNVYSVEPEHFTTDRLQVLQSLASLAAIALQNARLFEQTQRRVTELRAIHQAGQQFQKLRTPETLAQEIIRVLEETLNYEYGAVLLLNETGSRLVPFALSEQGKGADFVEADKAYIASHNIRPGEGITGWVAQTGQSVRIGDVRQDQRYYAMRNDIRSELCVPLHMGEQIIGVVNIETIRLNAYTEADQRVLETVAAQIAVAIQNAYLYDQVQRYTAELEKKVAERTEELRRRRDELVTLYETSLSITLATDLEVVLERIAEAARSVVQADGASILLYDERLDRFSVSAIVGWGNGLAKGKRQLGHYEGITRRMLREREPVIIADVRDCPDIHPLALDSGMRSLLVEPVEQQQRLLGVLYVTAQVPDAFDERHLTVLRLFANQAAVAIENARLLQRQQVEAKRLRTLNELMVGIVGAHALDRMLDAIAQAAIDLLGCDMAAVALYDPVADEIRIPLEYGHRGFSRAFVEQYRLPSGSGAGGKAFAEGRVSVISDTRVEGVVIDQAQAEQADIRAMLVGPLQTPEHKLGVLYANQRHPYAFSEDEVALFSILAGQAAVALENVRLYEGLQARSRELAANLEELDLQYLRQAALAEIELAINQPHELQAVLNRIVEVTTQRLPASVGASVILWDAQAETFFLSASTVPGQTPNTAVHRVRKRGGATRWIVDHHQPLTVTDVRDDPFSANRMLPDFGIQAYAGVPLLVEGEALGVLYALDRHPREYTQENLDFLSALASRAAVAITKVRLYEQAQTLAALEERQRLARDLHDAVSQSLFSASVIAETLPRLWERNPEIVRQNLSELHRLTRGALAEMRTLLLELRPAALAEANLGDLLRQLTEGLAGRTQVAVSLKVEGQRPLPPEVKTTLFRLAQEALNNITKHARASQVQVSLQNQPERVILWISDDGRGFDPTQIPAGHMGLNIMHERANAVGATLKINSRPGHGTEVVVIWSNTERENSYD